MSAFFSQDGLHVSGLNGGLFLSAEGYGLLLDTPEGCAHQLDVHALKSVQTIITSSGRLLSLSGLVGLLGALLPHRDPLQPLSLHIGLGDERTHRLANAWSEAWSPSFPLRIDTEATSAPIDAGPFHIRCAEVYRGEPIWSSPPHVQHRTGRIFQISYNNTTIVYAPACPNTLTLTRWATGATLLVVEIGVQVWPPDERPWRLNTQQAIALASRAEHAWIVGDNGDFIRLNN